MIVIGLGVLYHVAVGQPEHARFGVVTPGALVATLLWLIASGLFAVYTANFASYSKTYGSLASIVVVLLWLYLSAIAVLIGAEIERRQHGLTHARHLIVRRPHTTRRRPSTAACRGTS